MEFPNVRVLTSIYGDGRDSFMGVIHSWAMSLIEYGFWIDKARRRRIGRFACGGVRWRRRDACVRHSLVDDDDDDDGVGDSGGGVRWWW